MEARELCVTCATIHGIHCAVHGGGTRVEMNAGNGPHLFDLFMPEDIFIIDRSTGSDPDRSE
ncbi:MAG: hypothetical protein DSY87_02340 [Methylococcus sp.]|nr:MAG: hypothetical protein DSY87_02340 [Methylococcus sp.]